MVTTIDSRASLTIGDDWLSFSLTPVQGVVTAARTVRDLAVGSRLIGWLVHQALQAGQTAGGTPLYPFRDVSSNDLSIPNQFVMTFQTPEAASSAATAMQNAVTSAWCKLGKDVKVKINGRMASLDSTWDVGWDEQLSDFWDVRIFHISAREATEAEFNRLFPGRTGGDDPLRRQWDLLTAALLASKQVRHFPIKAHSADLGREHAPSSPILNRWDLEEAIRISASSGTAVKESRIRDRERRWDGHFAWNGCASADRIASPPSRW